MAGTGGWPELGGVDLVRPFTIWPVKIAIRIKRRIRSQ